MFAEMRKALNITKQVDILEHIYSLPTPEAREEAMVRLPPTSPEYPGLSPPSRLSRHTQPS